VAAAIDSSSIRATDLRATTFAIGLDDFAFVIFLLAY
jgi:hypothetical protein